MTGRTPSPQSSVTDPRQTALTILVGLDRTSARADDLLDESLSRATFEDRDRNLLMELVYGVLRHRLALDWRLNHVAAKSIEGLPSPVRAILRLGAYQLLELTKIPPHAAIDTSVTMAKRIRRGEGAHWGGFVNAVLRALSRNPLPPWPDPKDDPHSALSIRYSCPAWLVDRWLATDKVMGAERLCAQTLDIPPLTLRANSLRTTRDRFAETLHQAGREFQLCEVSPVGLRLPKQGPVSAIPGYTEGHFYIEDEAAQLIPPILAPQPGERVLDACAAPGGKTTHLAALMQNHGTLVAVDRDPARLKLVQANCHRLGVSIVEACPADLTASPLPSHDPLLRASLFDRILVDAPCSALGVLRRHPEAKWHKTDQLIATLPHIQLAILTQAARLLRPGGVMVYSTCSTESEENERVVDLFCRAHPEFSREPVTPWLPPKSAALVTARGEFSTRLNHLSMDGFFASRLRKAPE